MDNFKINDKVYIAGGDFMTYTGVVSSERDSHGFYLVLVDSPEFNNLSQVHEINLVSVDDYLEVTKRNLQSFGCEFAIKKPLEYWDDENFRLTIVSDRDDTIEVMPNYDTLYKSLNRKEPIYIGIKEEGGRGDKCCIGIDTNHTKEIINYLQKCVDYLEGED